ncbi:MAG TPA: hypothetical protein VLM38_03940 [Blastocatellia bacterium]|nr:hypothetical protein [Blastocatellia bacterium]
MNRILNERERSIRRGIQFIYRTACDAKNFKAFGFDYLSCFSLIASTSRDGWLRRMAREMGRERARQWRTEHPALASDAAAKTIEEFIDATVSADDLGVRDGRLKETIQREAKRFSAQDYLGFDPATEPPPGDIPKQCRCDERNPRGRKTCRNCKRRLLVQSRYQSWMNALYRGYRSDRSGVRFGTRYADALAWLPEMRPYCRPGEGNSEDFYYSVYAVTHLVYTLNDYGRYQLSPRWLPCEFEFLKAHLNEAIAMDDPDMVGEFMDTLKAFGLADGHPLIRKGTEYLLSVQNTDGGWGDSSEDECERYHPTWTAVDGLRDFAWRGERLSFPKLKPLLQHWARIP